MRTSLKIKKAAFLAAGLVSTWDVCPANATQSFSGEITPTYDLTSVYFLFAVGPCAPPNRAIYAKKISDFIPANTTMAFNITLSLAPNVVPAQYYSCGIFGLYDTVGGGVTLSYDPNQASHILAESPTPGWVGTTLPQYFNGYGVLQVPQSYNTTEASAAAALKSGVYNGIPMDDARIDGLSALGPPFPGTHQGELSLTPFTLINFSGAAYGGSGFIVQAVPEPKTISFLLTGATFMSLGWLRRRK